MYMDSREAIQFVTRSSARLAVLRATCEPTTLADLTTTLSYSRETLTDAVEWYEEQGWIKEQAGQYVQTVIGAAIFPPLADEEYRGEGTAPSTSPDERADQRDEDKRETDQDDLKFIVNSRLRERMLRAESLPTGSTPLATRYKTSPATALRTISSLTSKGWFEKRGTTHDRTFSGSQALDEFEGLLTVTEQALDKKECLHWLDPELADLPVRRLANAQTAVNDAEHIDAAEELFEELTSSEFDRYRGITTHVNNSAAKDFSPHIQNGVQAELLVTPDVVKNLPVLGSTADMVKNGINATNFDMLIAPRLPVSMSIFDDEVVFFGPRPEDIQNDVSGVIVSADEKVVEWALDLYWSYREQSRQPPDYLIRALLDKIDSSPRLDNLLND
jgi:predicted transcriptional regulator